MRSKSLIYLFVMWMNSEGSTALKNQVYFSSNFVTVAVSEVFVSKIQVLNKKQKKVSHIMSNKTFKN